MKLLILYSVFHRASLCTVHYSLFVSAVCVQDSFCPKASSAPIPRASAEKADRELRITCHSYNNFTVRAHWNFTFEIQHVPEVLNECVYSSRTIY